jgi:hypothetical protein
VPLAHKSEFSTEGVIKLCKAENQGKNHALYFAPYPLHPNCSIEAKKHQLNNRIGPTIDSIILIHLMALVVPN